MCLLHAAFCRFAHRKIGKSEYDSQYETTCPKRIAPQVFVDPSACQWTDKECHPPC